MLSLFEQLFYKTCVAEPRAYKSKEPVAKTDD